MARCSGLRQWSRRSFAVFTNMLTWPRLRGLTPPEQCATRPPLTQLQPVTRSS